jgi:glycosyltransferase involved in cell wall biosynthesis
MKVLIAAAQFSSEISGIQRHSLALVDCLLQLPDITKIHFVLAPWQQHLMQRVGLESKERVAIHVAEMNSGLISRNIWYYRHLPRLVAHIQPDIVHLSYPVPVDKASIRRPIVLTLHDLYPYDIPENFGFPKVLFNQAILRQCLRSTDAIACVSDTTLSRLKRHAPRSVWQRASRIYNCVKTAVEYTDLSPLPGWNGEPFLLSVSQHRKNKNILLLIKAFRGLLDQNKIHSRAKLVVIGIPGPETPRIEQLVSDLDLNQKVVFLDGLSEASLQWCYRHCEVLVAPSQIEGFGLPVAEALLAGCRVVCSDISAFREIDHGHCHFFQPGDRAVENLIEAIIGCLSRPRPSSVSLPQFSPEILGIQYLNLYQRLSPATVDAPQTQHTSSMRIIQPAEPSL